MKNVLMIIAPENFRDEELFHTKEELEKVSKVTIASKVVGEVTGMLGGKAVSEISINDVNVYNYDAIVFVGGSGASVYFLDSYALKIARDAFDSGKIVAAICIAPSILANAGILAGKKTTSYPTEKNNLIDNGANYTGKPVEVDGKIVTGVGPQAAHEFGKAIAELLI